MYEYEHCECFAGCFLLLGLTSFYHILSIFIDFSSIFVDFVIYVFLSLCDRFSLPVRVVYCYIYAFPFCGHRFVPSYSS